MTEDFILPDIGEGIVECELVEWLVSEGDIVAEDQPVADVQTDKALVQIPAKHAGRIEKLYVKQGDIAKVHAPLFKISMAVEENSAAVKDAVVEQTNVNTQPVISDTQSALMNNLRGDKVLATPAVRRIARENNVDVADVTGSGPQGRILKSDMLSFIGGYQGSDLGKAPLNINEISEGSAKASVEIIPLKGIRSLMAKQMMKAVSTIPHFTYAEEIDITECNQLRRELNDDFEHDGIRLTLMAMFIKSLSLAMQTFPILNSHMNASGDEIHQHREHNIGMAVDSPMGLLVPNIKSVNRLTLSEVAVEVKRLTDLGRAGRLSPDDLKGGTITISNIGAIGGTVTTPIINAPEVAIVGIGRIQKLPRPDTQNNLVVREIITVSWSGDHRVIDGGTIARFNNQWKDYLEQPARMLLTLR